MASRRRTRRTPWTTAIAAVAITATAALTAAPTAAAGGTAQVAHLNHTYTVLEPPLAAAIAASDYLKRFGVYEERTTSNGQTTYTGLYLMGRETYLEMFPAGALPPPDDQAGTTGLALSTDRAGDIDVVTERLRAMGTEPFTFTQTRGFDGEQIPWFDVSMPVTSYESGFSWTMEYLPSYFDDPRTGLDEPAAHPGDVSRERYLADGYRTRLMRDVVGVDIALPQADIDAFALTLRAGGFHVRDTPVGVVAVGHGTVFRLEPSTDAEAGWQRIVFALNEPAPRHVEHIGNSTLTVGPGAIAVWTFD